MKFWALCTSNGYLLNVDLYCGKYSKVTFLNKCALGSRVVMSLLDPLFRKVPAQEITKYRVYFDNYFTSFDLILHLKKYGLKSTGTIRENRVKEKNIIDKKALRGTYAVKHDENSGKNYISVKDSKVVSVASTAAGVTPKLPSQRYNPEKKARTEILFPYAFHVYNKFMGGVDLHDSHCSNVLSCMRSKKWTWVVLMRLIQAAIVNALVIYNASDCTKKKVGTKDFALAIVREYFGNGKKYRPKTHKFIYKTMSNHVKTMSDWKVL